MPLSNKALQIIHKRIQEGTLPTEVRVQISKMLKSENQTPAETQLQTPIDPSRPTAMFQETIDRQPKQTPVQPMGRVFPKPLRHTPKNIFSNLLPKKVEEIVGKITPIEPFKKLEKKVPVYEPSEKYQLMVNSLFEPSRLIAEKIKPEGATGIDVLKNAGEFAFKVGKKVILEPILETGISLAEIPYYLKTGKNLPSVDIPIYGNLSSLQKQTKDAIKNGMNPMVAALYYGSIGILDVARVGLMLDAGTKAILANQKVPDISRDSARQILQVPKQGFDMSDADYEDLVHRSYIKMSAFHHPDRYLDATQKEWAEAAFKEIQKAYLVLQHPNVSAAKDIARVLQADPRDILAGRPLDTRDFVSYFVDAHRTLIPEATGMMPEPTPAITGLPGAIQRQAVGLGVREIGDVDQTQLAKPEVLAGILYHGTTDISASKIMEEGFIPHNIKYGVPLTSDPQVAKNFAEARARVDGGKPVVLRVDASETTPTTYKTGLGAEDKEFTIFGEDISRLKVIEVLPPTQHLKEIEPLDLKSTAKELIRQRYSEIQTGLVDSKAFTTALKKEVPLKIRERIPFAIEGTEPIPEGMEGQVAKIREYFKEGHKFLSENLDEVGFVENYVNHIWDIPKNKRVEVVSRFTTRDPFLKERVIPTLQEGIDMGLTPKTTDIAELISIYDRYKTTVVANKRFVDGLTDLADENNVPLIQRIDKAPADWKVIDHPTLSKSIGIPSKEGVVLQKLPVKVHPEIADAVETVLGKPFTGLAARSLDIINAFTKKTALSLSLFFHWSIGEAGVSAGVPEKVLKLWNPGEIYSSFKSGNYGVLRDIPLTKDALTHGLQLGPIADVHASKVEQVLKGIENRLKNVPAVNKLATGVRGFNEIWDKALWDYYHNSMKLYAYENWVQVGIKKAPNMPVEKIKDEVAQLVNDTFGGQVWENFLVTPKAQQVMHWILLSPDWTLSTLRQAASPFAPGIRGKLGRGFWLRAGFYFFMVANAINYKMSEKHLGEGRWMWENDPKHKTLIFIGYDENGQKKYLRAGKQFREIFEWFYNPVQKLGNKLAPPLREAISQLTGYSSTGWKTDWAGKGLWDPEALEARAKSLINLGMPYSVSSISHSKNILGLAFPIQKGLSWYEARELMMDAINKKDEDYLTEIWRAALENNLDAKGIYESSKSEIKIKRRWERKDVQKLINDLRKMGKDKGVEKLREMKESGELTEELEKQMRSMLLQELEVKKQRKKTGI